MRRSEDDVIAVRHFERDDGTVIFSLYRPIPFPDDRYDADPTNPPRRCDFTIHFPDGEVVHHYIVGIDDVQAILLALRHAEGSLTRVGNGTPQRRPAIRWLGQDDLGLTINSFE
ncbi:DUF6968 family protein [Sphingomonas sp. 8AM]|uniref:DUF6968 family protein n=1 Tax=Sphingomonas sp. 8AM TaxID=2653170 RepID=UPI0012F12FC2|nr:hypothetical protein [Sphingomonas sp. 8AM]VXC88186.1 hypothetical protein SPHINGO8AM_30444 [Sphingomonas sp. 8AM]